MEYKKKSIFRVHNPDPFSLQTKKNSIITVVMPFDISYDHNIYHIVFEVSLILDRRA